MNERKESTTSIILEYVRVIVLTVIATFIFLQFVQISRVNGSSMENTYFQNNIVLIDKVFYKHSQPKRNDIIIVDYDDGLDDTLIIKRVIAVGGDHLDIKNNEVYINGKKIGTMKPDEMHRVIWKDIKLDEGRNTVRVEGKNGKENLSDSCEWYYIDRQ